MPPNGVSTPHPCGLKLWKLARCTRLRPAKMKTTSAEIFSTTKMLLVVAVSRMPIASSTLNNNTKTALTTSNCECAISQFCGSHHDPWMTSADCCAQAGSATPKDLSTSCTAAENCCATGAADMPYSKISANPMIQAKSFPIVAYAYV